jgi:hypothetical protein
MSDIEPKLPLELLDPGCDDPQYWERSHARIMRAAQPHLAQRAAARSETMGEILLSWSRLVVPVTMAAAAVAGLILLQPLEDESPASVAGLVEVLHQPDSGEPPLPYFLHEADVVDRDMILFAMEEF